MRFCADGHVDWNFLIRSFTQITSRAHCLETEACWRSQTREMHSSNNKSVPGHTISMITSYGWEIAGYHNTVLRDPHAQILGSRLEIWMRTLEECDT